MCGYGLMCIIVLTLTLVRFVVVEAIPLLLSQRVRLERLYT